MASESGQSLDVGNPSEGTAAIDQPVSPPVVSLLTGPGWGVLFAILGGALAWGIHQALEPVFVLPEKYDFAFGPPPELEVEFLAAVRMVNLSNRVFAFGLIGALLGTAVGLAEGIAQRSLKRTILYSLTGGLIAALFGCGGGAVGHTVQVAREAVEQRLSLSSTAMVQCAAWGILGAGVGLAFGVMTGRTRPALACLGSGLIGGGLGGMLYLIVISLLLPSAQPQYVIPLGADIRLLWIVFPALILGLMLPLALRRQAKSRA